MNNGVPFSKLKPADKFYRKWSEFGFPGSDLVCLQSHGAEHKICGKKFDFAWPSLKVVVEVDGFGYGHQAQQNMARNNAKRNAAVLEGWSLLVFDSRLLGSHEGTEDAVEQVCRLLELSDTQKRMMSNG